MAEINLEHYTFFDESELDKRKEILMEKCMDHLWN
jgi:hypothetical protein